DAVGGDVDLPADEPARPLRSVRNVHRLLPRFSELDGQVLDGRVPEPLRLVDGTLHQRAVVVEAVTAHEADDVGAFERLVVRRPDDQLPRPDSSRQPGTVPLTWPTAVFDERS